jgi:hypothetical protein
MGRAVTIFLKPGSFDKFASMGIFVNNYKSGHFDIKRNHKYIALGHSQSIIYDL